MSKHGGVREGAGRKPKAEEQAIIEKLSPLEDEFLKGMKRALENDQGWGYKLYAEYYWGKPKERLEIVGDDTPATITFNVVENK